MVYRVTGGLNASLVVKLRVYKGASFGQGRLHTTIGVLHVSGC